MSIYTPESFVQQYASNFLILSQQKQSRFEACVDVDSNIVGASKSIERIGQFVANDVTTRHADTALFDVDHSKRWLDLTDKDVAALIDELDKIRMLADPQSPYLEGAVMAMNRKKDDAIIAAARGSVRTLAAGTGSVALPSTQKIAEGGTAGLTLAKLLTTKEIFDGNEVDEDDPRFFSASAKQMSDLLNTTEIKSHDYNTVRALCEGKIDTFLGFKFIRSQRLPASAAPGSAGNRYCLAWTKSGMRLGIGADIKTRIAERPDKRHAVQVYVSMSIGAARTEEARVVEVAAYEASLAANPA